MAHATLYITVVVCLRRLRHPWPRGVPLLKRWTLTPAELRRWRRADRAHRELPERVGAWEARHWPKRLRRFAWTPADVERGVAWASGDSRDDAIAVRGSRGVGV